VGIAGEDDLDAPDLDAGPKAGSEPPRFNHRTQSNGRATAAQWSARGGGKLPVLSTKSVLPSDQSLALREHLIAQLVDINSTDQATTGPQQSLSAKNTLTVCDAKIVEEKFQERLSAIGNRQATGGQSEAVPETVVLSASQLSESPAVKTSTANMKRSRGGAVSALRNTVRLRNKEHRKFVSRQACLVCGRTPSDPHHLTFTQPRALGHRVSDEFTVPVCRVHHRELHRFREEVGWWQKLNIDPLPVALRLWQQTQCDAERAPTTQGIMQAQATETTDVPVQDRAGMRLDPGADAGNSVSGPTDGLAGS